jgi:hypothetical protein
VPALSAECNVFSSDEFTFEAPPGWTHDSDAEQLTFFDDRDGVLIISSSRVIPAASAEVLEQVLVRALAAVKRAASNPELRQVTELHQSAHPSLRCWRTEARTHDGSILFSQCVVASARGVLLATLETQPPEAAHRSLFQGFIDGVACCVDARSS